MVRLKRSITGLALTAVSALSLSGVAFAAQTGTGSRVSLSESVHLCLNARRDAGYFDRDTTRAERNALRLEFRTCIREAVKAHVQSRRSSRSSVSSSVSSSTGSSVSSSSRSSIGTVQVLIDDNAYMPSTITIKKGTKVRWTNQDDEAHTVTGNVPGGPNSGQLDENDKYSFTFTGTGTYNYHCAFHPNMTGSVLVTN